MIESFGGRILYRARRQRYQISHLTHVCHPYPNYHATPERRSSEVMTGDEDSEVRGDHRKQATDNHRVNEE
jgi:hypothetical protein